MNLRLTAQNPLLNNHRVRGGRVLPGVAYIDLIFRAAEKAGLDFRATELRNLVLFHPCAAGDGEALDLRVEIEPQGGFLDSFSRVAISGGAMRYASAELHAVAPDAFQERLPCTKSGGVALESAYSLCRSAGLVHDGFMKAEGEILEDAEGVRLSLSLGREAAAQSSRFLFHPVLLDAAVLGTSGLMAQVMPTDPGELALPVIYGAFRAIEPLRDDCQACCRRAAMRVGNQMVSSDIDFFDGDGRKIAELRGVVHKRKDQSQPAAAGAIAIQPYLLEIFARKLRVPAPDLDIHTGFYELGMNSAQMLEVVEELGRMGHATIEPTLLFEHTTIAALQAHLSASFAQQPSGAEAGPELAPWELAGQELARRGDAARPEPIAVIGLSGRYPMANSVAELWQNLVAGRDCITEIPPQRWDRKRLDDISSPTGKPLSRWGGFVDDADCFDAHFFRISPREAELMDPQERLFLQAVWEAIEDAGYRPDSLVTPRGPERRNKVGVFAGLMHNDYQGLASVENSKGNPTPVVESYATVVNRVAYIFNFHGPNLAVDTACSSSLTALHLAVESLRSGSSEVALAGGVNLSFNPDKYITYGLSNMHATDGRCRAFGEGGDGYVSGEGVGVAVLKPLSKAQRDGDRVYALINATEINHGGRASGITVPNPTAHTDLIAACLEKAGTPARTIGCIEAHGTGTSLGDPIEFAGLLKAFRASTPDTGFCAIGSIKSNIGHAEAAAGIAGFTKQVLQLYHRKLVPSLHAETLNSHIDFEHSPFFVPRVAADWMHDGDTPRRAGVSSFGAGGSNAHVTLEEWPEPTQPLSRPRNPVLVVVSAKSEDRLRQAVQNLYERLQRNREDVDLERVARTLQVGRVPMEHRLAVVAADRAALLDALAAWHKGAAPVWTGVWTGRATADAVVEPAKSDRLEDWAQAWVRGWEPDWNLLYRGRKPQPISLPHYPFAKTRYWIALRDVPPMTLYPIFHEDMFDEAASREGERRFRSTLEPGAFYVEGHDVDGRAIVPGAMYLEMARAAGRIALGRPVRCLRNALWSRPLDLSNGARPVNLRVAAGQDSNAVEVTAGDGTRIFQCGLAAVTPSEPPPLDLAAIRERCSERFDAESFYARFARQGIRYGHAFRQVRSLIYGGGEGMAELAVPEESPETSGLELHPALLDGAFQTMLGLLLEQPEQQGPLVPFGLQELVYHRAPRATLFAYARWRGALSCDITVVDSEGRACLELRGYQIRPLGKTASPRELFFGSTEWQPAALPLASPAQQSVRPSGSLVFIAGSAVASSLPAAVAGVEFRALPEKADNVAERAEAWFQAVFGALRERLSSAMRILVLVPDAISEAATAPLAALLKTARQEHPRISGCVIRYPLAWTPDRLAEIVRAEHGGAEVEEVRYTLPGVREARRVRALPQPDRVSFRERGVYWITGGWGGLGRIFALYLAKSYHAIVVLSGRAESEERKRQEAEWRSAGLNIYSISADVSVRADVESAYRRILDQSGALHGVFHNAGVIEDRFLAEKTLDQGRRVFAAKVYGAVWLDEAIGDAALDWMIFASSGAGVLGNAGQADYAAANAFLDRWAEDRNRRADAGQRHGRAVSICWPLWSDGGMRVDPQTAERLRRATGMTPLATEQGLECLERAIGAGVSQVIVAAGEADRIHTTFLSPFPSPVSEPDQPPASASRAIASRTNVRSALERAVIQWTSRILKVPPSEVELGAPLDEHGFDSIMLSELTNCINDGYNLNWTPAIFFETPSLAALVDRLAADVPAPSVAVSEAPAPVNEPLDAIAVVGMAARLPGSPRLDRFWEHLRNGDDCIREIPAERWDWRAASGLNRTPVRWGGFIEDADKFDPLFFGISPREAQRMDPQQRVFLETAWAAIEDAGYDPKSLAGSNTGLFAGVSSYDYNDLLNRHGATVEGQTPAGVAHSMLANRVSYLLDLHGPSEPVDTACSSSLVALHRAVRSLEAGDCDQVIVGGVNLLLSPAGFLAFEKAGMLSTDGRCKTFAKGANGYVRGEGVGVLLLKPLSRALADGDSIYGLIRGTAENHGGRAHSLTSPNGLAQEELLKTAYRRARVPVESVGYVEAHGTGTELGDPVEINALKRAFRALYEETGCAPAEATCGLGSVKTNIGHLEAAAGIAGVIKVLLALKHKQLPASLHCQEMNPYIELGGSPFYVVRETEEWKERGYPRRAGVSSFGFGGTNAHVVLEEWPEAEERSGAGEPVVVVVSARTEERLRAAVENLRAELRERPAAMERVAYTLQVGREAMESRVAWVARDLEEWDAQASAWLGGRRELPEDEVARRWMAGETIDWGARYRRPVRRLHLPGYPFARERYWIPGVEAREEEVRFTLRAGDPLLAGHMVQGQPVYPGAGVLELVETAIAERHGERSPVFADHGLADVVWMRPVVVSGELAVRVVLRPAEGGLEWELRPNRDEDGDDDREDSTDEVVYSRGRARWENKNAEPAIEPQSIDPQALQSKLGAGVNAEAFYAAYRRSGVEYGPAFRGVASLWVGEGEALGWIVCEGATPAGARLDAALQCCAAAGGAAARGVLPYSVGRYRRYAPLPERFYAHVRKRSESRWDLLLAEPSGAVLARIEDFAVRGDFTVREGGVETPDPETQDRVSDLLYLPHWRREPLEETPVRAWGGPALLVGGGELEAAIGPAVGALRAGEAPGAVYVLGQGLEAGEWFRALQTLVREHGEAALDLFVVSPYTPEGASLAGFTASLAKEYPRWRVRNVLYDGPEGVAEQVAAEPPQAGGEWTLLRGGERYVRAWARLTLPAAGRSALREGGVYVIAGGAGGLGYVLSEHLVRRYGAQVVWLGRRPADARIAAQRRALEREGNCPLYLQADIAEEEQLRAAVAEVKGLYGAIHGVVHSALTLSDGSVGKMTAETLKAVLRPKVAGSRALGEVFQGEALDWLCFFSSAQSFSGSAGQANYSAACAWQDAYAEALGRETAYPVRVINWGYWGEVGVVSGSQYGERMARLGVGSIGAGEGLEIVERVLAEGPQQVAAIKLSASLRRERGLASAAEARLQPETGVRLQAAGKSGAEAPLEWAPLYERVNTLALCGARQELASWAAPRIAPTHRRLWTELRRLLHLDDEDTPEIDPMDWRAEAQRLIETQPAIAAQTRLLACALDGLRDILSGARQATEVLFPEGSLELVSGVYRGNPVSDFYNRRLAEVVAGAVAGRPEARVLEIGAGTGGTTTAVLEELRARGLRLAEYRYTDLSQGFLRHGEESYGGAYPYLETARFDVEQRPEEQGLKAGAYDVVIAANVLHATASMARTLENAKALLKRGGLLVLNEISRVQPFSTLTFGLLEGWWRFADGPLRLPGSPGLSGESWVRTLEAAGFRRSGFACPQAHPLGQQVIVAESDGVSIAPQPAAAEPAPAAVSSEFQGRAEAFIKARLAEAIHIAPERIERRAALEKYGIDSILVVEVTQHLEKTFGRLSRTLLFECRTLEALTAYFLAEHGARLAQTLGLAAAPEPPRLEPPRPAPMPAPEPARSGSADQVAIIGLSGRYPQAANLDQLWANLRAGRDSITEIPAARWDHRRYYNPGSRTPGKTPCKWGGFLDDVDCFDAQFFNISPREAEILDPQERLFLETAWHTLEDAGYRRDLQRAQNIGVFLGVMYEEYPYYGVEESQKGELKAVSGSAASIANRVSYVCNLEGPSLAVDTQCSSSLTALHLACESLRRGECEMALAGGVNLSIHPNKYIALAQGNFLSSDGRCKSFGEGGDGIIPGEGVGCALLKPLRQAQQDGDHIYGVIRASSLNHGGKTNGYTVPNPQAQTRLIARALEQAGVDARRISYVEAHGTGTSLGDPIEIAGLAKAYAAHTGARQYCAIGSIKSNIGHSEAAAGIAGLTKVLLQMEHGELAPSLHAEELNRNIVFEQTPFRVQRELAPWTAESGVRMAAISSFGAGGANAHLIVEQAPGQEAAEDHDKPAGPWLLVLSARNGERLRVSAEQLRAQLRGHPAGRLMDAAYTLQVGREALQTRLAILAEDLEDAQRKLDAWLRGEPAAGACFAGEVKPSGALEAIAADEDLQHAIASWLAKGKLGKLAELWVNGLEVDWSLLYRVYRGRAPRRIPLPGYPFAQTRYWLQPKPSPLSAKLHPLIHQNVSDFRQQRFATRLDGTEPCLMDHIVVGRKTLPGAAYLEMARAAGELSAREPIRELRNVTWIRPLEIDAEPLNIEIRLKAGDPIAWEVGSDSAVYCRGTMTTSAIATPSRQLDLDAIRRRCTHTQSGSACYRQFEQRQVSYGPMFRGLHEIHYGEGEVLAEICLRDLDSAMRLHPALVDSALQAALGFSGFSGFSIGAAGGTYLPVSVRAVRLYSAPLHSAVLEPLFAHLVLEAAGDSPVCDVALCDQTGRIFMELEGVRFEAIRRSTSEAGMLFLDEVWTAEEATVGAGDPTPVHRLVILDRKDREAAVPDALLVDSRSGELGDAIRTEFQQVFDRLQRELIADPKSPLHVLALFTDTEEAFHHAALAGLLKSAHLEHPHLHAKVVYVPAGADLLAILEREAASVFEMHFGVQEIRYRPERQVKQLRETALVPKDDAPLSSDGVYWITGGLGGLGRLFAEHLCRGGATVILSGRRSCPAEAQTWIQSLNTLGGAIVYRQMDVAGHVEVQSTFEWIRSRYGRLSGVLHCAGILRDAMIVKKDRSEVDEVLRAKISGALNLDAVTAGEPLDFFVLFSSGSGTLGNAGQSDYAGANAFLNAFAAHRAALVSAGLRHGRTTSIAWPLWAEGGMRIDAATAHMMQAHSGLMPMPARDGMEAFDRILAAAPPFVMVAHGVLAKLRKTLLAPPPALARAVSTSEEKSRVLDALVQEVSALLKIPTADIDPEADLSEFGFDSITFTELINNLNDHYHLDLSKTILFEHSTLDSFVAHLAENYAGHFGESEPAPSPTPAIGASVPELKPAPMPVPAHASDPIAIVGVSAIFPGASDLETFWRNLEAGIDSVAEVPKGRWDWRAFSTKTTVTRAGFISGVDQFDPVFFGISPREAKLMDPQERLFLQAAWKAMEDAGHSKADLSGSKTGVFAGVGISDYAGLLKEKGVAEGFGAEPHFWVANRVSYALNLHGPSASIDTACSSSLVAVHRAVRAIEAGECEQAIAGGVNILVSPDLFLSVEQSGVLSRDGRCKTFDRDADGYVRGEGVAALFLKPLSAALRDRNPIYGIIRGTAENHGGHTTGVTVPNPNAQADLLLAAYRKAGFDLSMIDYFEAHGTGTPLGDPVEINGILKAARALSQDPALRRRSNPSCAVGSVKANIGHLEAGAGVASVVKMLLAMRRRTLPGNIHLRNLNQQINVEGSGLYFPSANQPWGERCDDQGEPMPRRAGVSSFGVGGSNAHVVLEEWPEPQPSTGDTGPFLIVLSARSPDRLEAIARNLLAWPIAGLRDAAYTLQVGRDAMSDRAAFLVHGIGELKSRLQRFIDGADRAPKGSLPSKEEVREEVSRAVAARDWPTLGDLWARGADIPWATLYSEPLPNRVPLPTYPFKPRRCWVESDAESAIAPAPMPALSLPALPSGSVKTGIVKTEIVEGRIAIVTMQDREQRNMLSDEVVGGLIHAFSEAGRNQEIRAIIVTGSGGVFGMGGTEEWLNRLADGKSTCVDVPFLYEGLLKAEVPVIAAMQGHAAGGSLVFGLYADMIVMAEEGVYCANFMKYGFTPGMGATYLLEKKLGPSLAAEMMYTAKWFRGEELEKRGAPFVFRPAAEVLDQAIEMARMLAEKPRESLAVLKRRLSSSILEELPRVLAEEVRMHDRTLQNPEVKERIQQQFHKRESAPPAMLQPLAPAAATLAPRPRIKLATLAAAAATGVTPSIAREPVLTPAVPAPVLTPVMPAAVRSVREEIANIVMRVLDMRSDDLDDRLNFRELGVDSIRAIEIVRDINKGFHLNLDAVILYDHPTIDAVAEFVSSRARVQLSTVTLSTVMPSVEPAPASAPSVISETKTAGMDIAVIGIAGSFAGAPDIDTFWANIAAGVCSVAEVPPSRWPLQEFYDPDPDAPDKSYCKWGGLLEGVDCFDPLFFNLSPVEAEQMEPQQRLFLETAWHAVEDAGYAPQSLKDFICGVFAGAGAGDYGLELQKAGVAATPQSFIGTHVSILPARIAYHLNLTGPTMAIDTACSSSLVAVHQACQSLLHGDCTMALAGGVSVMATSALYVPTSKAGMLSPTGLCKTFDSSADGFVPAEGVAVLVLKPLEHALRDRDSVYAVIKASGVNQDGATNGITAPSAASQETLLTGIYRRWGIDPERIGYLEAHGTGTQLGDPIEVLALTETFRKFTNSRQYCAIGSVKTNVGHPLAAAGVAGLVKAIMALRAQQLPPTLHCKDENRHIDFAASPFYVNRTLRPWTSDRNHPRQAAVSSFGLSGANAHIVLEEHCIERPIAAESPALIVLSAKTQDRLQEVARRLREALRSGTWSLNEIAYTLQTGREAMPQRIACVAGSPEELIGNLERLGSAIWAAGTVRRARDLFPIDAAVTGLREIAEQWVRGGSLDWNRLYRERRPWRAHLPGYPFARERSWVTPASEPVATPAPKSEPETLCLTRRWVDEPLSAGATHDAPPADRLILTDPAFTGDLARIRHAFPHAELITLAGAGMSLEDRVEKRFLQLFRLLQRRISGRPTQPQEVFILTPLETSSEASIEVGDAAPMAALLKTAHLENPLFRGKVIQTDGDGAAILQAEAGIPGAFEQVRVTAGSRQVEQLCEVSLKEGNTPIREQGVYWLTGGLGGLGRIFAEHIASVRGAKIILSGRGLLTPERGAWVSDLRERGVSIEYLSVDAGDRDAVETAFQHIKSKHGPLTGIIHSAGVIHDAYLLKKTPEQAEAVLRPKVRGAVHLDEVTREERLDFVVFFSSGSGAFGNPGQADYAAANAFLDAFAARRNALVESGTRSGVTVSIGWPLWAGGGMGVDHATEAVMKQQSGAVPLAAAAGIRIFEEALQSPYTYVLVAAGDLAKLRNRLLRRADRSLRLQSPAASAPRSPVERPPREQAIQFFKAQLSAILKVPPERIEADAPFEEYGIDSVMVVRLNSELESVFGPLSKTLFFEYQTLEELVDFFLKTHAEAVQGLLGEAKPQPLDQETHANGWDRLAEQFLRDEISEEQLSLHLGSLICSKN